MQNKLKTKRNPFDSILAKGAATAVVLCISLLASVIGLASPAPAQEVDKVDKPQAQAEVVAAEVTPVFPCTSNDFIACATVINNAGMSTLLASNVGATVEVGEPAGCVSGSGRSLWWRWTAPVSGPMVVHTTGSAIDTVVDVYSGASPSTLVTCNDDLPVLSPSVLSSMVSFHSVAGETYHFRVSNFDAAQPGGDIRFFLGSTYLCRGRLPTIDMRFLWQSIETGHADDVILGTDFDDNIVSHEGNDRICSGDGDDQVIAGDGNDHVVGGRGIDTIFGELGNDNIWGGDDGDFINGGFGIDRIRAEDGDDRVWGGGDRDVILGGSGNDEIHGGPGRDSLFGGDDDDDIWGDEDTDLVRGGSGNDELFSGPSGNDRLVGGPGDDVLDARATTGSTRLLGDAGHDTFFGSNQLDRMWGHDGNDTMVAGGYHDLLRGGDGADEIYGQAGRDTIDGGNGDDQLFGGPDADKLVGVAGHDLCHGGPGPGDVAHHTCEDVVAVP